MPALLQVENLPSSEIILDDGYPVQGDKIVEFRLLYRGKLEAGGSPQRVHPVRKQFHPQLKELWDQHPLLHRMAQRLGLPLMKDDANEAGSFAVGIDSLTESHNGFKFVPLVQEPFFLRCSLDILFLRREAPGKIYMKGDIDGRLKTLFDALRVPRPKQEIQGLTIAADEDPLYVLLADDDLISEVKVTTDRLLMLPDEVYDSNQVFLVINVKLQPYQPSIWAQVFM